MSALSVSLGDIEVGVLEHFDDESEAFTFSKSYLSAHIDHRPVLGQIFEDRFPRSIDNGGPFGWFDHLLPQGVMRRWRARLNTLDVDDGFGLLTLLGDNLPGAVVLRPTESTFKKSQKAIQNLALQPADPQFRFSLAGAQWKLSANLQGRGLTTNAQTSGIEYIAKFHSPEYPELPNCEFATMSWAKTSGILLPDFELRSTTDFDSLPSDMPVGNGTAFVCRRFDREGDVRIHTEDFAQILDRPAGPSQYHGSYEEIAKVLQWIASDHLEEFIKVVIFCVFCGNGDAHLKNFSVLYTDGRTATLSPAYDLVSTVVYYAPRRENLALELGGSKNFPPFHSQRFEQLFRLAGWDFERGEQFFNETVDRVMASWQDAGISQLFSTVHREKIELHMKTIR